MIMRGFTPREEVLIERVLECAGERPMGLLIERAHLDDGVLGMSAESITGAPVILLDLDGLPDSAACYVICHELAHCVNKDAEFYRLLGKSKALDIDEKRILHDLIEVAADRTVEEWGFDWAIAGWRRAFPDDPQLDPQWIDQARRLAAPIQRKLARAF